jgi:GNAT superfamily N-acetyltransferase
MSTPRIRAVRLEDNARVADLICQVGHECTARQMHQRIQRLREHPDYGVFVAELDGEVVGLVAAQLSFHLSREGRQGRLVSLVVDESHQGEGLRHQLMEHLGDWMRKQEVNRVLINTQLNRHETHEFYRQCGFEKDGYRFVKSLLEE